MGQSRGVQRPGAMSPSMRGMIMQDCAWWASYHIGCYQPQGKGQQTESFFLLSLKKEDHRSHETLQNGIAADTHENMLFILLHSALKQCYFAAGSS
jgi:hypothetical protein